MFDITHIHRRYPFYRVDEYGNSQSAHQCRLNDCLIRTDQYTGFINTTIAIGQARHYPVPNRTPVGECGMMYATTSDGPNLNPHVGSAIPGNHLPGPRYRISAVAPKTRQAVAIDDLMDQYVQTDDIISYLMDRTQQVINFGNATHDLMPFMAQDWPDLNDGF